MNIDYLHSALLIVDIQNDFFPGGALGVHDGDKVIEPLNCLTSLFHARNARIVATQDWHPENHASFATSHNNKMPGDTVELPGVKDQILWPKHCIQGSTGAEFHKGLDFRPVNFIIRKGFRVEIDSYSAFFENDRTTSTGLDGLFKSLAVKTVVIGGLATDYCVFYSALDAIALGYKTIVIEDSVCGVNIPTGSVDRALKRLKEAGVIIE